MVVSFEPCAFTVLDSLARAALVVETTAATKPKRTTLRAKEAPARAAVVMANA
jgi:hypothetical protein